MLKPSTCTPCQLYTLGNSFTSTEGKGRSGVIMIGEASGHEESINGTPFVKYAQAGSKLEECIKLNGLVRDDFLITNILRCQPPSNRLVGQWYASGAIAHCNQYLQKVIQEFVPPPGKRKVILALGATAYSTITGRFDSILDVRGYCFCDKWNLEITVIGSLHPAFIKRGHAHWTSLLVEDIKKAVAIAGQEEWETPEKSVRDVQPIVFSKVGIGIGRNVELDDDNDIPF